MRLSGMSGILSINLPDDSEKCDVFFWKTFSFYRVTKGYEWMTTWYVGLSLAVQGKSAAPECPS
jgi:hypothetical protein